MRARAFVYVNTVWKSIFIKTVFLVRVLDLVYCHLKLWLMIDFYVVFVCRIVCPLFVHGYGLAGNTKRSRDIVVVLWR